MTCLLLVMLLAFSIVVARLTQVQALSTRRYVAAGESQRVRTIALPASRGSIFDRTGQDLALSVDQTTIFANPHLVTDPLAEAQALAPLLSADPIDLQTRLSKDAAFVYLARKADDDTVAKVKALNLAGVDYMREPARFLPAGGLALPLIGLVGTDNEGLSGLEVQYGKGLAGTPGAMIVERDPSGQKIPWGDRQLQPSVRGDDLVLTIDRSLQYETERSLGAEIVKAHAKGGMAIVMQAKTGELLAMANLETAADGTVQPASHAMTLTNAYEPGSVNKLITISGALEEGLVQASDHLLVPNQIKVADAWFREHENHPTQEWSITDIVANSSNVGSIMIGQKLGKEKLDHYMRAFGFGKTTGLRFPGETAGIMLDPKKYSGTSMGTMPIGQGIAITAVQMLAAYNTVANDGVYVAPKLVKATIDRNGGSHPTPDSDTHRVVSARTAQQMTAMLGEVVRVGTGKLGAIPGYTVAGKTGTARKPLEGARGYKDGAYVSTFAGFAPAEDPALTTIVMLDEPTPIFGGLVAAPVFSQITQYALRQFRIPPPAAPPPPVVAATASVPRSTPGAAKGVGEVGDSARPPTTVAAAPPQSRTP